MFAPAIPFADAPSTYRAFHRAERSRVEGRLSSGAVRTRVESHWAVASSSGFALISRCCRRGSTDRSKCRRCRWR